MMAVISRVSIESSPASAAADRTRAAWMVPTWPTSGAWKTGRSCRGSTPLTRSDRRTISPETMASDFNVGAPVAGACAVIGSAASAASLCTGTGAAWRGLPAAKAAEESADSDTERA